MNVTVNVPEDLYRRATEVAAAENISVDDLFASAFEERLLEFERLKEKASRGSYEKFLRIHEGTDRRREEGWCES